MRGRPVLGAVSGFFFGCFLALTLQQFGVRPIDSISFFGLPGLGLVLGLVMATWAPFGRSKVQVPIAADAPVPEAGETAPTENAEGSPAPEE